MAKRQVKIQGQGPWDQFRIAGGNKSLVGHMIETFMKLHSSRVRRIPGPGDVVALDQILIKLNLLGHMLDSLLFVMKVRLAQPGSLRIDRRQPESG